MHFFRFHKTWFYPADQGRPHPGYQTMSIIKGTLRHSKGEFSWRKNGRVQRFKNIILRVLRTQQGRGERKETK